MYNNPQLDLFDAMNMHEVNLVGSTKWEGTNLICEVHEKANNSLSQKNNKLLVIPKESYYKYLSM